MNQVPPADNLEMLSPRKRVMASVRRWVAEGRLTRGDLLPTEQELCTELQVSRGTVRAALQQLEDEGVLAARAGNGRLRARTVRSLAASGRGLMADTIVLVTHLPDVEQVEQPEALLGAIDTSVAAGVRRVGRHLLTLNSAALNERDMALLLDDPPMGIVVGGAVADYASRRHVLLKLVGQIPMVVNSEDPLWQGCDRVVSDHAAGAYALTRWALAQGRRRLLCLWPWATMHSWALARMEGYHRAMIEAGVEPIAPLARDIRRIRRGVSPEVFEDHAREVAGLLVDRLIPSLQIDGILTASDQYACVAATACRLCGVRVHDQVLVMGYDNMSGCPNPDYDTVGPAATIDKGNAAIGRRMIELLLQRIDGQLPPEHQLIRMPPMLVTPQTAC